MNDYTCTATYSPDDNKLRLYSAMRLDKATYERVKAHGFKWAPKQNLFVSPRWTPERENLCLDLAGEIADEDTSLVERQEERAERFETYSEKRAEDAERAHEYVAAITDNIPLGQPILIGHHSERHARKDAERIENGMRKAVKMWETSKYWEQRAQGALAHAKYKELPQVRARRIKTIEADKRRAEKGKAESEKWLTLWSKKGLTHAQAVAIASLCHLKLRQKDGDRPGFDVRPSAYNALTNSHPSLYAPRTLEEVIEAAQEVYPRNIAYYDRWIMHYANRLAYETAMLAESGGIATDKTGPEKGGACKCWASPRGGWSYIQKVNKVSVTVLDNWGNGGNNFTRTIPFDKLSCLMTKAQVDEAKAEGRLIESQNLTGFSLCATAPRQAVTIQQPERTAFDDMKDSLAAGVQTITAPQLFPTPKEIAERMIDLADIQPGERVLEPSAGTGNLLRAMPDHCESVAIEINPALSSKLLAFDEPWPHLQCTWTAKDFLLCNGNLGTFDKIVMNPPFERGADIQHIQHAMQFLKPGGRLVALCANGPRQQEALGPLATTWENLPPGSFASQGTHVNVVLLTIQQEG